MPVSPGAQRNSMCDRSHDSVQLSKRRTRGAASDTAYLARDANADPIASESPLPRGDSSAMRMPGCGDKCLRKGVWPGSRMSSDAGRVGTWSTQKCFWNSTNTAAPRVHALLISRSRLTIALSRDGRRASQNHQSWLRAYQSPTRVRSCSKETLPASRML